MRRQSILVCEQPRPFWRPPYTTATCGRSVDGTQRSPAQKQSEVQWPTAGHCARRSHENGKLDSEQPWIPLWPPMAHSSAARPGLTAITTKRLSHIITSHGHGTGLPRTQLNPIALPCCDNLSMYGVCTRSSSSLHHQIEPCRALSSPVDLFDTPWTMVAQLYSAEAHTIRPL